MSSRQYFSIDCHITLSIDHLISCYVVPPSNDMFHLYYQVILICPSDDTHTQGSGQEELRTGRVQGLQRGEGVFYATFTAKKLVRLGLKTAAVLRLL